MPRFFKKNCQKISKLYPKATPQRLTCPPSYRHGDNSGCINCVTGLRTPPGPVDQLCIHGKQAQKPQKVNLNWRVVWISACKVKGGILHGKS